MENGLIDIDNLKSSLRSDTILVSVMYVNNEIGVIQDIESIGELCRDKKIVFMGTPQFAVEALKKINESNHQIVGIVCPPDKPSGRGHKLKYCEVKQYALSQNLKVLQPEKLKSSKFLLFTEG